MNRLISKFFIGSLAFLLPALCQAGPVSPEEALARAGSDRQGKSRVKSGVSGMKLKKAFGKEGGEAQPMVYLFSSEKGFLLAPANDEFPAVLGYGVIEDADAPLPPAMKWWIEQYSEQMRYALDHASSTGNVILKASLATQWQPIEPLVKTKWDQSEPYNNLCPEYKVDGRTFKSVTGCVATSMAQVINYHKWPVSGTGVVNYMWEPNGGEAKNLSLDFRTLTFDWTNMLDEYTYNDRTPDFNEDQGKAVAQLMLATGMSVEMNYDRNASGAYSSNISGALIDHFGYSKDVRYFYRDYYSSVEWEKLIYDNLSQGLPVIYGGQSEEGGHSFVCDGYAGDHYFHFNWGWSGISDGYFLLCRLNPEDQGIGSYEGGYNSGQTITCNIHPAKDGNLGTPQPAYIVCTGNFCYGNRGGDGSFPSLGVFYVENPNGPNEGFFNMSSSTLNGSIGIMVEDSKGFEKCFFDTRFTSVPSMRGDKEMSIIPFGLKEGKYKVYPAYSDNATSTQYKMLVPDGCRDHLDLSVNSKGILTYSLPEESAADIAELVATAFRAEGPVYKGAPSTVMMSVTNLSQDKDYYGKLTICVADAIGEEVYSTDIDYSVPADITLPMTASLTFDLTPGKYKVSYKDRAGKKIGEGFPLTVSEGTATEATSSLRIYSVSPTFVEPQNDVELSLGMENKSAVAQTDPKFEIKIYPLGSNKPVRGWTMSMSGSLPSGIKTIVKTPALPFMLETGEYVMRFNQVVTDSDIRPMSGDVALYAGYPVENVTIDRTSAEMAVGSTLTLQAQVEPADALFSDILWQSTDNNVASVSQKGVVKALSAGEADIVASTGMGQFAICHISVDEGSGVESVGMDDSPIVEVLDLAGKKVLDRPSRADLGRLEKGVYIVVSEAGTYKIVR